MMGSFQRVKGPGHDQLAVALKGFDHKSQGKVGWFETAKYESGIPVATVAAVNEYGAPSKNIPPRPTIRPAIVEHQKDWKETARAGAVSILKGQTTQKQVLDLIGQQAAGDIAKNISELQNPPLKPATIKARLRKKSDKHTVGNLDKPLIDTELMFSTLTNIVEDV